MQFELSLHCLHRPVFQILRVNKVKRIVGKDGYDVIANRTGKSRRAYTENVRKYRG